MHLFTNSTKRRRLESTATALALGPTTTAEHAEQLQQFRKSLPVYQFKKQLIQTIAHNNNTSNKVVIIVAQTGSGKSTQIPAYLLNYSSTHLGSSCIAVTQPRRVAAISLAQRVALENGCTVGKQVGYRVRFEDCTCPSSTQLIYVTDGMLLREAMTDPWLQRYSCIFLDECHERSLQTDILLGVVYQARKARATAAAATETRRTSRPLQLVVMSATLEIETFRDFFGRENTTLIQIPGRQFPVQILYTQDPVTTDYLEAALSTIVQIHQHEEPGDILAFLPGQEEIEDLASLLKNYLKEEEAAQRWTGDRVESLQQQSSKAKSSQQHFTVVNGVLICLLYAALPPDAQMSAFQDKPAGCTRKIILSTNIAETSVTLPDIKYVVDTGKHKCRQVLAATGMESLTVQNVSQAQAAQRAGRCGRVQAGICFRLYTEDAFQQLPESTPPEILRVSLTQVVLQLKGMGVHDPRSFDFVSAPDAASIVRAMKLLYALEALNDQMELTTYGKQLAKLPLDPVFGNLILKSTNYSCTKEMLTAVSALSTENLFYRAPSREGGGGIGETKAVAAHRRFASHEGDLPTYLNVYSAWQTEAVYVPTSHGGRKAQKKLINKQQQSQQQQGRGKLLHGEWCQQNFISGRALVRAYNIRNQLKNLCGRPVAQHGLGMDVSLSCGTDRKKFLKCVAAGLFLQAASRVKPEFENAADNRSSKGRSGTVATSTRGRYRTKVGNELVSIHPTSTMFGRQPAPGCVVYSELVTTKRTYIRGVTQIREEWLQEVAPNFYS